MKEIGGFFELELSLNRKFPHYDGICVNSGRNALEYILRTLVNIKHIWIPYYTCEVVLEPIKKLNIPYSFYRINSNLELETIIDLDKDNYILVTNYFGLKDKYIKKLSNIYRNYLIVDNAQAFFSNHIENINTIYSPRKFVGVPDGGIVYARKHLSSNDIIQDQSFDRCSHLLKRIDLEASSAYLDFKDNSHKLSGQPISIMSKLTKKILCNIDFDYVKNKRLENFYHIHSSLQYENKLKIPSITDFVCPMVYPFYTENKELRTKLIEKKVYVAKYWPNVQQWCNERMLEFNLVDGIIPIPIDQRYDIDDMNHILQILQ